MRNFRVRSLRWIPPRASAPCRRSRTVEGRFDPPTFGGEQRRGRGGGAAAERTSQSPGIERDALTHRHGHREEGRGEEGAGGGVRGASCLQRGGVRRCVRLVRREDPEPERHTRRRDVEAQPVLAAQPERGGVRCRMYEDEVRCTMYEVGCTWPRSPSSVRIFSFLPARGRDRRASSASPS